MNKKIFTLLIMLLTAWQSYAQDITQGGVAYTSDDNGGVCAASFDASTLPSTGIITIPATVKDANGEYKVTSIGVGSFSNETSIKGLDLSGASNLTRIGDSAFLGCTSLTGTVTIPASVTEISDNAFDHTDITALDLSGADALTSIGSYAFYNDPGSSSLAGTIKIPKAVTSIGDNAFNNTKITTLNLSTAAALETIGNNVFNNCSSLTGMIKIPASVTSIGDNAFTSTGITVDFSAATKLTSIGDFAFSGCKNNSVAIPSSVSSIGIGAFYDCSDLTTFTAEGSKYFKVTDGALFNANGNKLLAFPMGSTQTSFEVPASTDSICSYAFIDCSNLKTITFEKAENITYIGENAFYDSGWLNGQTNSGILYIGNIAYTYIGDVPENTTLTFKDGTTSISPLAFIGQTNIIGVSFPSSLKTIGNDAFNGCTSLTGKVTIPAGVTEIGLTAFYNTAITSLDLSEATALTSIGGSAFGNDNTSVLTGTIKIPANVKTIGNNAFRNTKIESLDLSEAKSLTEIEDYAFYGCTALKGALSIPASVETIGVSAFQNTAITSLDLTGAVALTSIGFSAFSNDNTSVLAGTIKIPASVEWIGEYAFQNCKQITKVYFERPIKTNNIGAAIFDGCADALKIFVNDGTYSYATDADNSSSNTETYKNTYGLTDYADKIYPYLPKDVTDAKVATLYLPYEAAIPEGVNAYYCSGVSNNQLNMTQLKGGVIPACTPVYLSATKGSFNFESNQGTTAAPLSTTLQGTAIPLECSTVYFYYTLGCANGETTYGFYPFTGTEIAANTCYIQKESEVNPFTLSFDDGTSGISKVSAESTVTTETPIYDLQGRRVQHPSNGLYIVNGKKIIFK